MQTLPLRFSIAAVALLGAPLLPVAATAASAPDTTKAFCTQLQTSQSAIGAIPATAKNRFSLISAEWTKMARFAPTAIKGDVNSIAAAYKTANAQTAAAQKTTLGAITKAAQNVTTFTSKSCAPAGEGGGPGGGQFAELAACVTKKGATLPTRPAGGGGAGNGAGANGGANGGGRGGRGFGNLDAATQAALDACRAELGISGGFGGGAGGGGGVRNNPQVVACLKKKGVTLPTTPAGQQGQGGNRQPLDAKSQTALDACRKELGLPAGGPRNATPSTVKA